MSRPRRYRVITLAGRQFGVEGECMVCSADHERWGLCGHWELLPYRWSHRRLAADQAALWRARQSLLLEVAGPQRLRPPRHPVAA